MQRLREKPFYEKYVSSTQSWPNMQRMFLYLHTSTVYIHKKLNKAQLYIWKNPFQMFTFFLLNPHICCSQAKKKCFYNGKQCRSWKSFPVLYTKHGNSYLLFFYTFFFKSQSFHFPSYQSKNFNNIKILA